MGIKDIKKFIREKSPRSFFTLDINHLRGHKVAIDANNWMYTNHAIARKKVIERTNVLIKDPDEEEIKKVWFTATLDFILKFFTYGITPVFVFDGTHHQDKSDTQRKRREDRKKIADRIDEAKEKIKNMDLFDRALCNGQELAKDMMNYNTIRREEFEAFRQFLNQLSLPVVQAVADGEQLCSSLCWEGKVSAVFSADTDCLVYGCPLLITNFSKERRPEGRPAFDCIRLDYAIEDLQLDHCQFVDFCIMCGTDFNVNMKGYGSVKSYQLLKKYLSIDMIPKTYDVGCLNHKKCRDIFSYKTSEQSTIGDLPLEMKKDNLGNCSSAILSLQNSKYNLGYYLALIDVVIHAEMNDSLYNFCFSRVEPYIINEKSVVIYV